MGKKKNKEKEELDFFKPIDLSRIGTPDDPCFGKEYDPRDSDCRNCGDIELCAIAQMQNNRINRAKLAESYDFKDLDEAEFRDGEDKKKAKELIKKYQDRGYSKQKAKRLLQKRLNMDDERTEELLNTYK